MQLKVFLFVILFFFCPWSSFAEILGEFSFEELVLNASYEYTDPKLSRFSLDGSVLSVKWEKEKNTSVTFGLGPLTLLNRTIYFAKDGEDQFGLIEAKASYRGAFGEIEMGLIPIEFSLEGRVKEGLRDFYRGMVFRQRLIGLRDFGIAYAIENNNFYTRLMIHNGEGRAENPDGRIFYSSYWGWVSKNFEFGISGQTGDVKVESINPTLADNFELFNLNHTLKSRSGAISVKAVSQHLDLSLEYFLGQVEQNEVIKKWNSWHADIIYKTSGRLDILARADYLDPNRDISLNALREFTLGLSLRDKHKNSRLFLYATKVIDEGDEVPNDRYSLVWRLQPEFLK